MKKLNLKKILSALLVLVLIAAYPIYSKLTGGADEGTKLTTITEQTTAEDIEEQTEPPAETHKDEETETENAPPSEAQTSKKDETGKASSKQQKTIDKNGSYTSKDDVALYIHTYGKLPKNFMTKKEAQNLGWTGGSLEKYAPGKSIGGDYFGNYEGKLPKASGRKYTECDIDTLGKSSRGAKRIIFSNDGLIYYTGDHYEHFEKLY